MTAITTNIAPPRSILGTRLPSTRSVLGWIVTLTLLATWAVTLRPVALGGPAAFVAVHGESMEPTMAQGDLVITRERANYEVGDAIAYRVPKGDAGEGSNVIHRVTGGNGTDGYATQGDNNAYTDVWHPTDADVIGAVWVKVPGLAGWVEQLRRPGLLALVVGLVTFVVVALPDRRRRDPSDTSDETPEPERFRSRV